jgi:hypothetical protein
MEGQGEQREAAAPTERRKTRVRLPGWTREVVVQHGLGVLDLVLNGADGISYRVRLDGRASGPVFFSLSAGEMSAWREARMRARGGPIGNHP